MGPTIYEKKRTMETMLRASKMPAEIRQLLERPYFFTAEQGSRHESIAGTIKSIRASDEGLLVLEVTSSMFWGKRLFGLAFNNGAWYAYIQAKEVSDRFIPGEILLL